MLLQSEGIRLSIHAASYPRRTDVALVLVPPPFTKFVDGECHVHGYAVMVKKTALFLP